MMNWIKHLFRHRHKWETTHTNRWQHPTRQMCHCGLSRDIEVTEFGMCRWEYSNGDVSDEFYWGEQ